MLQVNYLAEDDTAVGDGLKSVPGVPGWDKSVSFFVPCEQNNQMSGNFIIAGASHAASMLAPTLRREGWQGPIIVVGAEASIPYHRPPLSKDYLAGDRTLDEILIRPAKVYEKSEVEFILNTGVEAIDRDSRTVRLSNNETLPYDKLALTVGSKVRKVNLPGVDLDGVFYLRDLRDVERIQPYIHSGANAVIVGGGYIGLETAGGTEQKRHERHGAGNDGTGVAARDGPCGIGIFYPRTRGRRGRYPLRYGCEWFQGQRQGCQSPVQ